MAFSYVQSVATTASAATTCTLPSVPTPGNVLVIGLLSGAGSGSPVTAATVTDENGNSYTLVGSEQLSDANGVQSVALAYGIVPDNPSATLQVSWSASQPYTAMQVMEFHPSSPVLCGNVDNNSSAATSTTGLSVQATQAGSLAVAYIFPSRALTVGSPWTQAGRDGEGGYFVYTTAANAGDVVAADFPLSASGFYLGTVAEFYTVASAALPTLGLSSSVGSVTPEVTFPPVGVFTLLESASSSEVNAEFINLTIPAEPGQMYMLACNYASATDSATYPDIQVFSSGSFNDVAGFYGDKVQEFSESSPNPTWGMSSVIHFGTITSDMLTTDAHGNTQLECRAYVTGSGEALFTVQTFDTGNYSNFVVGSTATNYTADATSVTTSLTTSANNSLVWGTSMSWGIGTLNSGWTAPIVLDTPTSGGTVTNYSQQMFFGGGVASGTNLTAANTIPAAAQAAVFLLEIVATSMNGSATLSTLKGAYTKRNLSGSGVGSEYLNTLGMSSSLNSLISSISGTALAGTLVATLLGQSVTASGTANTNLVSLLLKAFTGEIGHSGSAQAALDTLQGTSAVGALDPAIEAPVILATLVASLTASTLTVTGTASQMLPTETMAAVAQALSPSVNVSQMLNALSAIASVEQVAPSSGVVASLATQVIAGALGSLTGSGDAETALSALTIFGLVALFHRIVRMAKASEQAEFKFGSMTDVAPMKISSTETSAIRLGTITESIE